jgi:hypothetical protein
MKRKDDWIEELYYREFINPKLQPKDFYWEEGKMVLTELYHIKKGMCCGGKCVHCPYWPMYQKSNTTLREDVQIRPSGV